MWRGGRGIGAALLGSQVREVGWQGGEWRERVLIFCDHEMEVPTAGGVSQAVRNTIQ